MQYQVFMNSTRIVQTKLNRNKVAKRFTKFKFSLPFMFTLIEITLWTMNFSGGDEVASADGKPI